MYKIKLTLKGDKYNTLSFIFDDDNEAMDFAFSAMERADAKIKVEFELLKEEKGATAEESEDFE